MLIKKKTINPYEWHKFFALLPVCVKEELVVEDIVEPRIYGLTRKQENVMYEEYVFLKTVERKLETNLAGTRRWVYRLKNEKS